MLILGLTATTNSADTSNSVLDDCFFRIAKGDSAAMARLYELTHVRLYAYVLGMVKNTADAQDVLQDTYMNVWSAVHTYRSVGKPMAWLFTIARNLSLMKLRESKHHTQPIEDTFLVSENTALSNDERLVLQQCLQTLADEERQIVLWHAVAGLKHREIAKRLDLPLSTVLSKYNRALKKLNSSMLKGEMLHEKA